MPDIKKIKVGETTYDIRDAGAARLTDVVTALEDAKAYADAKEHKNTTYSVEATENALEFTVTPSEGEAQTVTLVAPVVDTSAMKVTAGTDIVVTPESGTGEITVAHAAYQTGVVKAAEGTEEPNFVNSVTINNGHIESVTVQPLGEALESISVILNCGTSAE
jgi:hypothetical protein